MITIETIYGSLTPHRSRARVPGRGDSRCKGPEAGTALCLRKNPEACVAGAERMGRSGGGMRWVLEEGRARPQRVFQVFVGL